MAQGNLYDKSPKMERSERGDMEVKKSEKKPAPKEDKGEGSSDSNLPAHARHLHERLEMHARHEMEHAVHDHKGGGDKKEMHARHEVDRKNMHTKHQKEHGMTNGSPNVGAPIKDIEKAAKPA